MPPRFVVSLLAVPALALERFGYYAMRASFMTILSDRKTDDLVVSTLYSSMRTWGIALTILFSLAALVVARPVVAMLGVVTASIAAVVCVFGPESAFVSGLWFMVIGASAFKAVAFALCAEFVSSARMKIALVLLAFVALNAGATNGTDLALLLPTSLYPSLIAYVLATVVTVLLLGLSLLRRDDAKNEGLGKSTRSGAALFLLVVPTLNAMWIAYDTILAWQTTTGVTRVAACGEYLRRDGPHDDGRDTVRDSPSAPVAIGWTRSAPARHRPGGGHGHVGGRWLAAVFRSGRGTGGRRAGPVPRHGPTAVRSTAGCHHRPADFGLERAGRAPEWTGAADRSRAAAPRARAALLVALRKPLLEALVPQPS